MIIFFRKSRKILKKIFVSFSLFVIATVWYIFFSTVGQQFFPNHFASHPIIGIMLISFIIAFAYKPIDTFASQILKNVFFKKKNYAHMTLMNLAEELSIVLDLQEVANLVVNTFGEVLHLKSVALLIPNRVRDDFEIASSYGWQVLDAKKVRFANDSRLLEIIRENGPHVLVRDRVIRSYSWQEATQLASDLDALRAGWVIPLFVKEECLGAIAFSTINPDALFDESDFQCFREFAHSIARSVRNALSVLELVTANEQLQDVQSQLLQATKLTAIEQLATGLAHEIHNPLTIISGKAQVLLLQKNQSHLDKKVEEVLKTIVKQTKRAADITRKLLMFTQSSGSPKEAVRLEQILEDTIALVAYQTSLEGIEITRSFSEHLPVLYANVQEIREVFLNLILNAIQSIGSQGKIHCEILLRERDQWIEVRVADTGKGIDPAHLDKLFNPFFTTRAEAVGLGLFITKQIVHRYSGSIRVESRLGQGSLFIVQFPYMEPAVPLTVEKDDSLSLFPSH